MICPQCNKEIQDGAEFCSFCGKRLTEVNSDPAVQPEVVPEKQVELTATQRKLYLISGIVVLVALLASFLFTLLGGLDSPMGTNVGIGYFFNFGEGSNWKMIVDSLKANETLPDSAQMGMLQLLCCLAIGSVLYAVVIITGLVFVISGIISFVKSVKTCDYKKVARRSVAAYACFLICYLVLLSCFDNVELGIHAYKLNGAVIAGAIIGAVLLTTYLVLQILVKNPFTSKEKIATYVLNALMAVSSIVLAVLIARPIVGIGNLNFKYNFITMAASLFVAEKGGLGDEVAVSFGNIFMVILCIIFAIVQFKKCYNILTSLAYAQGKKRRLYQKNSGTIIACFIIIAEMSFAILAVLKTDFNSMIAPIIFAVIGLGTFIADYCVNRKFLKSEYPEFEKIN